MQKHFEFLLLGGGPASVSAAETLRAESAKGSILLVSDDVYAPYGHTYLSKQFLFGALPEEKLLIHKEAYYQEQAIDLMLGVPVVAVDTANRLVRLDGVGDIHFDKLLIATGTKPIRPTIPGSMLPGIHCLHTLADAEALRQAAKNAKRGRRPRRRLPRCRDRYIARPHGRSCRANRGKGSPALTACRS